MKVIKMKVIEWTQLMITNIPNDDEIKKYSWLMSDIATMNGFRTVLWFFPLSQTIVKSLSNEKGQIWWYQMSLEDYN